ncbi:MAG: ABC transporter permease [Chloroflexi bacterium]|nr:ABC transporter permease [Chloroflexota bacterium]
MALRPASRGARLWKGVSRFARNKPLGAAGGLICLFLLAVALAAPLIAPYPPKVMVGKIYVPPAFGEGWDHWGTDHLGRDVFSRIVWGARLSLFVGLSAPFLGTTIGLIWGLFQGYWGGSWFDTFSQRLLEAQLSIPGLVLALTFMAVFGPSITNVILAISLNYIPSSARTVRSTALSLREHAYVEAARAIGASTRRIVFLHMLPNTFSIYLVLLSLYVGAAIITEAALSFLGVGVPADEPSWGGMVTQGTEQALLGGVPWLALLPGLSIALVVYGFNLLGDALRDTLDPRLRGSRGR